MSKAVPPDHWKNRADAAKELTAILGRPVSLLTIKRRWESDPTCPIPKGRTLIPKQPLIDWARARKAPVPQITTTGQLYLPGADQTAGKLRVLKMEEEVRNLQRKNAIIDERMIDAEEAHRAIEQAVAALRSELLDDMPSALWAKGQNSAVEVATQDIRTLLLGAINRFAERCKAMKPEGSERAKVI